MVRTELLTQWRENALWNKKKERKPKESAWDFRANANLGLKENELILFLSYSGLQKRINEALFL